MNGIGRHTAGLAASGTEVGKPHRRGAPPTAVAALLGGLALALLLASAPLTAMTHDLHATSDGAAILLPAGILALGVVVARHRPANPIGWLAIATALVAALGIDGGLYAVLSYVHHHGRLPLSAPAVFLVDTSWAWAFALLPLVILLFPDGRLPSRRWRWIFGLYVPAAALALTPSTRRRSSSSSACSGSIR